MGILPWSPDERWLAIIVEATADADRRPRRGRGPALRQPGRRGPLRLPAGRSPGPRHLRPRRTPTTWPSSSVPWPRCPTSRGPVPPLEVRARAADGRWIHIEVVTTHLLDDDRFGGLILSIRDITDRRAAERGRASAERVLDHTFAHNPIGMTLCTLDGRFVKVNPAFCALVDRTEAELLADTYQGLTDPEELAAEQEALVAVIRGDQPSFTTDKRIPARRRDRAHGRAHRLDGRGPRRRAPHLRPAPGRHRPAGAPARARAPQPARPADGPGQPRPVRRTG